MSHEQRTKTNVTWKVDFTTHHFIVNSANFILQTLYPLMHMLYWPCGSDSQLWYQFWVHVVVYTFDLKCINDHHKDFYITSLLTSQLWYLGLTSWNVSPSILISHVGQQETNYGGRNELEICARFVPSNVLIKPSNFFAIINVYECEPDYI